MNRSARVALLASLGGACGACGGGDGTPGGGGGPDGGVPTSPRVAVVTGELPALIVFRSETSTEWQTPSSPSAGRYEFEVNGPYRVIVVCPHRAGFAEVVEYARTLDDVRLIDNECFPRREFPLHVRGQMLQSGEVFFGGAGRGQSNAPWSFDLPAAAGTFDLLTFFGGFTAGFDQVSIRRDLAIAGDLDVGAIDVALEHTQALVPTRFTATNLTAEESLNSDVFVNSGNTSAISSVFSHPALAWQVNLVPDAALRATDSQRVTLFASSSSDGVQQRTRSISRRVHDGSPTSLTLMDPLGPTTFAPSADRLVVTWSGLPTADEIDVSRVSFSNDFSQFVTHDFLLSRAFLASSGATSATLDFTDVPGFQPAWHHDPALEQMVALDAFLGASDDDTATSDVSVDIPAPAPAGVAAGPSDARRAATAAAANRARLGRATARREGIRLAGDQR